MLASTADPQAQEACAASGMNAFSDKAGGVVGVREALKKFAAWCHRVGRIVQS